MWFAELEGRACNRGVGTTLAGQKARIRLAHVGPRTQNEDMPANKNHAGLRMVPSPAGCRLHPMVVVEMVNTLTPDIDHRDSPRSAGSPRSRDQACVRTKLIQFNSYANAPRPTVFGVSRIKPVK